MLYPVMMLGLIGLAIPVILHLIQKQRLKPQLLATLQFLDPQDAANAFAPVPRDKLQLLLRLLLLGLFVLLMSRLFVSGDEVGPRSMVVILDQSLSMQRRAGEQSLFDRHKAQVLELIDSMRPDDKLALILAGDRISVETGLLRDRDELRAIAEKFEVSDGGGMALGLAIRRAAGLLAGRREVNACVVVFSDHQTASYKPALDELRQESRGNVARAFRDSLAGGRTRLFLVDDQPPSGVNLSIERASFSPSSVHVGASSRLTAVVRNHTGQQQTTQVRLVEGEQPDTPRSLTLEPGEAAHIDLVHRFESPVDTTARVEIDDDLLLGDNRFFLPMRIRERRQVLMVAPVSEAGEEKSLEIGHRGVDLLSYALNPGEVLGRGAGTFVAVKRVSPQALGRVSLPLYSLVVLLGVADLPEQTTKDLTAFVENGGGLWLIPESDVSPLRFQNSYSKLLGGFTLGALRQADPVQSIARDESKVTHPLLLPLLREEWGGAREISFNSYHTVESLGSARVVLQAVNGSPLAVVVPRGRGQVFVQLFGTSLEASTLPRTTTFVPMVQQVASFLGAKREQRQPDVMRVGEVRPVEVPEFRGLKGDVVVAGPQKQTFPLTGEDADEVRVAGLTRAGAYELSHPMKVTSRKRWLTVNAVQGASDLQTLGEEEQAELFGKVNVLRLPYAEVAGRFERNHEVFAPVIVLVFIAFAIEAIIGAWQSRRQKRKQPPSSSPTTMRTESREETPEVVS
jgi:hypothetical protein